MCSKAKPTTLHRLKILDDRDGCAGGLLTPVTDNGVAIPLSVCIGKRSDHRCHGQQVSVRERRSMFLTEISLEGTDCVCAFAGMAGLFAAVLCICVLSMECVLDHE